MKTYKNRQCKKCKNYFETRDCPNCAKSRVTNWRNEHREEYNEYRRSSYKEKKDETNDNTKQ